MKKATTILATALLTGGVLMSPGVAGVNIKGARSCGTWVKENDWNTKNWLVGYMSGLAAGTDVNVLKGVDVNSLFLWMDNYCKANPLKDTDDGGNNLFFELKKQKGLK